MRERQQEFEAAGARLAAVGLGDERYARAFRDETGIDFPLLVDAGREAYRAAGLRSGSLWHLLRKDSFAARTRAKRAGHRQRRTGRNPLQLGGSFVFGPPDIDLFVHVNESFGDHVPPERLLGALGAARPPAG